MLNPWKADTETIQKSALKYIKPRFSRNGIARDLPNGSKIEWTNDSGKRPRASAAQPKKKKKASSDDDPDDDPDRFFGTPKHQPAERSDDEEETTSQDSQEDSD